MNERIKLLAEQADFMLCEDGHFYSEGQSQKTTDGLQKFAELIVRECMTISDTESADYLKHRKAAFDFQDKNIYAEGAAACDIIKYKMKKHFGIE